MDGTRLRGIIHADIKPKNVRLNVSGQVKVLDFGIAKGLALSRKLTRNDFGSLAYLSPERLDSGEVDVHVDFWSVGVLLYEMLAAAPPFEADTNSKLESLIRRRQPPAPLPETCPPALARIVLKMLAGDQRRRYQSAGAMRADLEAFRDGTETQADREWAEAVGEETRRTVPPPAGGCRRRSDAPHRDSGRERADSPHRRAFHRLSRVRFPCRRPRGLATRRDGGRWAGARGGWRPRRSSRASRSSGTRRSCGARPRNCA